MPVSVPRELLCCFAQNEPGSYPCSFNNYPGLYLLALLWWQGSNIPICPEQKEYIYWFTPLSRTGTDGASSLAGRRGEPVKGHLPLCLCRSTLSSLWIPFPESSSFCICNMAARTIRGQILLILNPVRHFPPICLAKVPLLTLVSPA